MHRSLLIRATGFMGAAGTKNTCTNNGAMARWHGRMAVGHVTRVVLEPNRSQYYSTISKLLILFKTKQKLCPERIPGVPQAIFQGNKCFCRDLP